jgi:hypothetical protein
MPTCISAIVDVGVFVEQLPGNPVVAKAHSSKFSLVSTGYLQFSAWKQKTDTNADVCSLILNRKIKIRTNSQVVPTEFDTDSTTRLNCEIYKLWHIFQFVAGRGLVTTLLAIF